MRAFFRDEEEMRIGFTIPISWIASGVSTSGCELSLADGIIITNDMSDSQGPRDLSHVAP